MTRSARRRRDRVTVDELLRQTGARPRKPGSRAAELAARRDTGGEPGPSGAARMALASAVIVVLGGLVLVLATRSDPVPGSTQFPQLQPASAVPSSSTVLAVPTETTTPSPVVMHARKTPTPTPTVTVELPPPSPTTSVRPPTWSPPPWNSYPCNPYYCGGWGH
ncbi:hypothetical protein [Amycolatopsis vancoresmycina]|uniref:Uncharacterized protein n=1 Tax=Amycolatopsis vancoresmycina DSM 44592 TaxID=1292037 RepID=R1G2E2_9PSEU|nr:hypothetical protein [Amycolatopsis vancoresmycina]EOD65698.1 hypothetical protein H480_25383 [Amycolatopsis vancoresmycina DSM 44592]